MLKKIEGIVINKYDFADGSRKVTVLSKSGYKVDLLLKKILLSKKREIVASDLLSYSEFTFYSKNNVVSFSSLIYRYSFKKIKQFKFALYLSKCLDELIFEGISVFSTIKSYIKTLNYLEKNDCSEELVKLFLIHISEIEGVFLPNKKSILDIEKGLNLNIRFNNFMNYAV